MGSRPNARSFYGATHKKICLALRLFGLLFRDLLKHPL
jgi:hypothetical protein